MSPTKRRHPHAPLQHSPKPPAPAFMASVAGHGFPPIHERTAVSSAPPAAAFVAPAAGRGLSPTRAQTAVAQQPSAFVVPALVAPFSRHSPKSMVTVVAQVAELPTPAVDALAAARVQSVLRAGGGAGEPWRIQAHLRRRSGPQARAAAHFVAAHGLAVVHEQAGRAIRVGPALGRRRRAGADCDGPEAGGGLTVNEPRQARATPLPVAEPLAPAVVAVVVWCGSVGASLPAVAAVVVERRSVATLPAVVAVVVEHGLFGGFPLSVVVVVGVEPGSVGVLPPLAFERGPVSASAPIAAVGSELDQAFQEWAAGPLPASAGVASSGGRGRVPRAAAPEQVAA
ncbi:hypothetical protein ACWEGE_27675 [Amycolatopsis sp. NPDC004747]